APGDEGLNASYLQAYIDMDRRVECVSCYKRLLRENGRANVLLWNLGRAQQALADEHRAKGRFDEAKAIYQEAELSFEQYRAVAPQHAANTSDYLAILKLSLARTALDSGDVEAAKQGYAAAFELSPKVAETDRSGAPLLFDSLGGTY